MQINILEGNDFFQIASLRTSQTVCITEADTPVVFEDKFGTKLEILMTNLGFELRYKVYGDRQLPKEVHFKEGKIYTVESVGEKNNEPV